MTDTTEAPIDVVTLPARRFSEAWRIARAFVDDSGMRPILAAVAVEVHDRTTVRLVATNSYVLVHCWVSSTIAAPAPLDDEPVARYLFSHAESIDFLAGREWSAEHQFTLRLGEAPQLSTGRFDAALTFERGEYADWRGLYRKIGGRDGPPADEFGLGRATLPVVATLCDLADLDVADSVRFRVGAKETDPITFEVARYQTDGVPVSGIVMPVRSR